MKSSSLFSNNGKNKNKKMSRDDQVSGKVKGNNKFSFFGNNWFDVNRTTGFGGMFKEEDSDYDYPA